MGKGENTDCQVAQSVSHLMASNDSVQDLPLDWNSRELNIEYIDSPNALSAMVKEISFPNVNRIGLDIETTGGLKPWAGSVRLIQIGVEFPKPKQYLIDCWAVDPQPVMAALEDPRVEIVTCNGRFEQTHIRYRYGAIITNHYDVVMASRAIVRSKAEKTRSRARKQQRSAEAPYNARVKELRAEVEQAKKDGMPVNEQAKLARELERAEAALRAARVEAKESAPKPRTIRSSFRHLARRYLGQKISKQQQVSAWDSPVLDYAQRNYAANDVARLLDIRRAIEKDVHERGLDDQVVKDNAKVLDQSLVELEFGDDTAGQFGQMVRAMNHCNDPVKLGEMYDQRGRVTMHFKYQEALHRVYEQRVACLKA